MGFARRVYWSELPFPSPGDLPIPGIKPTSPALAGRFFTTESPGKQIGIYLKLLLVTAFSFYKVKTETD